MLDQQMAKTKAQFLSFKETTKEYNHFMLTTDCAKGDLIHPSFHPVYFRQKSIDNNRHKSNNKKQK